MADTEKEKPQLRFCLDCAHDVSNYYGKGMEGCRFEMYRIPKRSVYKNALARGYPSEEGKWNIRICKRFEPWEGAKHEQ